MATVSPAARWGQQRAGRADLHVVGVRSDGQHDLPAPGPGLPAGPDQLGGLGDQVARPDRFLQELRGRAAQRGDGVVDGRVPGQHRDRQAGHELADPLEQLEPVHAGQLDVGDQQVPVLLLDPQQGGRRVELVRDLEPAARQHPGQVSAESGIVVD
jgi:hypothetical protein